MLSSKCFRIIVPFTLFGAVSGLLDFLSNPIYLDYIPFANTSSSGSWNIPNDQSTQNTPDKLKFGHHVTLSEFGDVKLAWNFSDQIITFKLSAKTTGWIGAGIARDRVSTAGADFAIMGLRDRNPYIADMCVDDEGKYVVDKVQDVHENAIWEHGSETIAIFTRPLVTCDHDQDVEITSDTLRIIWAYGADDIQSYSAQKDEIVSVQKGSINIKLLNPSNPPLQDASDTDMKTLKVTATNVRIEQPEYRHCTAFRFPDIRSKAYIVQFEPIVTIGNEHNVREITVRQCIGSDQRLSSVGQVDYSCEEGDFKPNCKTILLKWAVGMSTFTLPENVGFAIDEPNTYFMMDTLYTNPRRAALVDSSGFKIYYTSRSRQHEAGVLTTGSLVRRSQIIPPRTSNFLLHGHCMKKCIQMSLPQDGEVTIFAALLHARETGRKIKVRHFRDGEEMAPIAEDNRFDYLHQGTEVLNSSIRLMSGDNMIVECTYDTADRNEITYVNNSKGGESCLAFLSYYPRVAKFTTCETAPTEKVIMRTVGAARPGEMEKHVKEFEWTSQQTREYNDQILRSQVYVQCGDDEIKEPQPIPMIKKDYVEHHKCRRPEPKARFYDRNTQSPTTRNRNSDDDGNSAVSLLLSQTAVVYLITAVASYCLNVLTR